MRESLLKAAGLYGAASVVNGVLPFLLLPILTRQMPPADFALTVLFTTVAVFAGAFTTLSLHGAINLRFFNRGGFQFDRYVGTCFGLIAIMTVVTAALVLAFDSTLSAMIGLPAFWLLAAVLHSLFLGAVQIRLVCWQVDSAPAPYVTFQLALAAVTTVATVLAVVTFDGGWQGRAGSQLAVMGLFAVVGVVLLRRDRLVRPAFDLKVARDALAFGVPLIPHSVGALLIAMSDRVLVASKLGLAEAGTYSAGMQIGLVTGLLGDAFGRAYNPWLYARLSSQDDAVRPEIVRLTYRCFAIALVAGMAIGFAAPLFAGILVNPEYGEASHYAFWISVGGSFQAMYMLVGLLITYVRKTHLLAMVTVAGGLLNVPLTSWLIDVQGAVGAAQAYAIIQAAFFFATWLLSMKVCPMPWFRPGAGR